MTNLLELIRIAVGCQSQLSHELTEAEWGKLFSDAKKQELVGVCFAGIEMLPKNQLPNKDLLLVWIGQAVNHHTIYNFQCEALCKIVQLLECEGLEYCLLKGLSLAELYKVDENPKLCPQLRTLGDFDIWIRGDKTRVLHFAEKYGEVGDVVYHHIDAGEMEGVEVELHIHPSSLKNLCANKRMQHWFDKCFFEQNELKICNVKVPVNSLAFNRIYVLNHIYRHLLYEGVGLRQFLDYYFVLITSYKNACGCWNIEKAQTQQLIKDFKMEKFSNAITWVLLYVFEPKFLETNEVPDWVIGTPDKRRGKFLLDEMLNGGNFGVHDRNKKYYLTDSLLKRYTNRIRYDLKFLLQYPEEVLWRPIWFVWERLQKCKERCK